MTETLALPTSTCFDDTVEIMADILAAHPDALTTREFLIVHAIVAPYGYDMSHAWIEDTVRGKVIFIGVLEGGNRAVLSAELPDYYADIKVKDTTKYSFMDAYREEKKSGRLGPWEEKYQRLCRNAE